MSESKLRKYETVFIVRPTIDEDSVEKVINSVEDFIKNNGGVVDSVERKGRRKLAYEVKKMRDGYYVVLFFQALPDKIVALKRMMSLSEDIIRSITVDRIKESLTAKV